MTTDDLIQQLGRDLRPVRRLSPSWQRAAVWLACGVVYVVAAALVGLVSTRRAWCGISRAVCPAAGGAGDYSLSCGTRRVCVGGSWNTEPRHRRAFDSARGDRWLALLWGACARSRAGRNVRLGSRNRLAMRYFHYARRHSVVGGRKCDASPRRGLEPRTHELARRRGSAEPGQHRGLCQSVARVCGNGHRLARRHGGLADARRDHGVVRGCSSVGPATCADATHGRLARDVLPATRGVSPAEAGPSDIRAATPPADRVASRSGPARDRRTPRRR